MTLPWLALLLSLGISLLLGFAYFQGLWLTVRLAERKSQVLLLIGASFLLRITLLAIALFLLANQHWTQWLTEIIGLLLGRFAAMQFKSTSFHTLKKEGTWI